MYFVGEDGVDIGVMEREFLLFVIDYIRRKMFFCGVLIDFKFIRNFFLCVERYG